MDETRSRFSSVFNIRIFRSTWIPILFNDGNQKRKRMVGNRMGRERNSRNPKMGSKTINPMPDQIISDLYNYKDKVKFEKSYTLSEEELEIMAKLKE